MHELIREQRFPVSRETVWHFISSPRNLNAITPPDLQFNILSPLPDTMYEGLIVRYRIKLPLFGTRAWVTEIKHIREGYSFVDEQRFGPYRFWYHYHELLDDPAGGVVMRDHVHYEVPFGLLGRFAHAMFVRRMLLKVFDFRWGALESLFGRQHSAVDGSDGGQRDNVPTTSKPAKSAENGMVNPMSVHSFNPVPSNSDAADIFTEPE